MSNVLKFKSHKEQDGICESIHYRTILKVICYNIWFSFTGSASLHSTYSLSSGIWYKRENFSHTQQSLKCRGEGVTTMLLHTFTDHKVKNISCVTLPDNPCFHGITWWEVSHLMLSSIMTSYCAGRSTRLASRLWPLGCPYGSMNNASASQARCSWLDSRHGGVNFTNFPQYNTFSITECIVATNH